MSTSYIHSVLQPGEVVRDVVSLHWVGYVPGIAALLVSAIVYLMVPNTGIMYTIGRGLALLLLLVALYLLFRAWWERFTTEYAVTDRRVIYKRGLVWRSTMEMNMDKVSSVDVRQSILGRLLNYGTVEVYAIGGTSEEIKNVASPLDFRNHIVAK